MTVGCQKAFRVYERWEFACAYCGDKPGRSRLQIDHFIPRAKGGSDDEENLLSSCRDCNSGKSDKLFVPPSMRICTDNDGCHVVFSSGVWAIKVGSIGAFVSGAVYGTNRLTHDCDCYEFELNRCWEDEWIHHIGEKTWCKPHSVVDLCVILSKARRLIRQPSQWAPVAEWRSDTNYIGIG